MAKFKVGDKVKCIEPVGVNPFFDLDDGGVYTVTKFIGNALVLQGQGTLQYKEARFEIFEEPLPVWVNTHEPAERPHSHYYKDFGAYLDQETGRVMVDVYAVLDEFEVVEPELQHLGKKVLCLGMRGHKLADEDLDNIIDTAKRLKERRQLKEEYSK